MRAASVVGLFCLVVLLGACASDVEVVDPARCGALVGRVTTNTTRGLDLLFVVDDSMGMVDQQAILARSLPRMLRQLVDEGEGGGAFADVHIAVVSSSLGGYGSDACAGPFQNERAHLLARSAPGGSELDSYEQQRIAVYDGDTIWPAHDPPGEPSIDVLVERVQQMVRGVGQRGCGYEAPLEAWYRFLIDPEPYDHISIENGEAVPRGIDFELLEQRRRFLRPNTVVAIVMLSNENDCSMRVGGQMRFAAQAYAPGSDTPYRMPKARAACATDPDSDCCRSCSQSPGAGCDTSADNCDGEPLAAIDDQLNLRCFDQKRRFGIDFLHPIDRYLRALTEATVPNREGVGVPNPLFSDLDPSDEREPWRQADMSMVFLGAVVGVPWQDLARRDDDGQPNALTGLDGFGRPVGGYQSWYELEISGGLDLILEGVDPLMRESIDPRSGMHGPTGVAIGGESSNPINGHERNIPQRNDLQYACITPLVDAATGLPTERDCSDPSAPGCDCGPDQGGNPLCDAADPSRQHATQAYPGLRQLRLVRELRGQGMASPICPPQQYDAEAADFAFSRALDPLNVRMQGSLCGRCLPRSLPADADGRVACTLLEARRESHCDCGVSGRRPVAKEHAHIAALATDDPLNEHARWNCFCELEQLRGATLQQCQQSTEHHPKLAGEAIHGWCYVDATIEPPVGNPEVAQLCPRDEQRILRFVGHGTPAPGATVFAHCGACSD